ncbi:hypothetical protein BS78_05G071700 [Paspalum vaginatum]|nr:hypothetical protein BS78_05G071700 [Paspalum vaginatum]
MRYRGYIKSGDPRFSLSCLDLARLRHLSSRWCLPHQRRFPLHIHSTGDHATPLPLAPNPDRTPEAAAVYSSPPPPPCMAVAPFASNDPYGFSSALWWLDMKKGLAPSPVDAPGSKSVASLSL